MLEFDAATTEILDTAYRGADVSRRRRANFDALEAEPGDIVLDLGCGNGLMTAELARAVGPAGRVIGVDPSGDMLASAREHCGGLGNVDLIEGSAFDLPLEPASIDRAVSLQVFEYFDDIPAALAGLFRALRPGGRLVIGDLHWDTFAMHSAEPGRMARMMRAWDRHLADRTVPATLPGQMRDAGFVHDRTVAVAFSDTRLRPDGLANMMIHLMTGYVIANALVPEAEARAWADEQRALAEAGRFFFTITHFVTVATRP